MWNTLSSPHHFAKTIMRTRTGLVLVFLLLGMGTPASVWSQAARMTTEDLTNSSDVILHGTVAETSAAWNADQTAIYTTVRLTTQEWIKSSRPGLSFEFQIPGGTVGEIGMAASHTPVFKEGDEVILFVTNLGSADSERLVVRGGEQGSYQIESGVVVAERMQVEDFTGMLREFVARPVTEWARVRAAYQRKVLEERAPSKGMAIGITSFTPTSAAGGAGTLVTISGADFGATQGSGTVEFTRTTSTWIEATVITWSNTEIKCLVPVSASSGPIRVTEDGGTPATSSSSFGLTYASSSRKWDGSNPSVTYLLNANTDDIADAGERAALTSAMSTWSASGANFSFVDGGNTTSTTTASDGVNIIYWGTIDGPGGTLAVNTNFFYTLDGTIIDSDIEFDDAETWSLCSPSCPGQFDVETVALHELGHTFNFYDSYHPNDAPSCTSPCNPKVMYGFSSPGSTQRSLFTDDTNGAKALYGPTSGTLGTPSGGGVLTASVDDIILAASDASNLDMGAGELTLEAWIRPTATPPTTPVDFFVIAAKSDFVDDRSYELVLNSNREIEFRISFDGSTVTTFTSTSILSLNTWTHVRAVIINQGANKFLGLWIDGLNEGAPYCCSSSSSLHNSSADFAISGVDYDGLDLAAGEFVGAIDEVCLSSTDRWHSTSLGHALPSSFDTDADTEAFWKFNDVGSNPVFAAKTLAGDEWLDTSGNGNNDLSEKNLSGSLPVELAAFDAVVDGAAVLLRWETVSETNNAGFQVEHRYFDGDFEPVDFVEGQGTTLEAQRYSYRVEDLDPGRHVFRLRQIDFDGTFEHHPEVEVFVELPGTYALSGAYPNPFNPETQVTLMVATKQQVRVEVYDVVGRRVALLHDGLLEADELHRFVFEAPHLPSGLYLYRVLGEHFSDVKSMTLVK